MIDVAITGMDTRYWDGWDVTGCIMTGWGLMCIYVGIVDRIW